MTTRCILALLCLCIPVAVHASPRPASPVPPARPAAWPLSRPKALPPEPTVPVDWICLPAASKSGPPRGRLVITVGRERLVLPYPTLESARHNAPRLAARLSRVASTRSSLREVTIGTHEGHPALAWRGCVVLPISTAQARDLGRPPGAIVASWVTTLRKAAADTRPPSSLPGEIRVPCGESRTVVLPPAWNAARVLVLDEPDLASVRSLPGPASALHVTGRNVGVARVELKRGETRATIRLRVMDIAGTLPPRIELAIAGRSPDEEFLTDAVERSLVQSSRARPGASREVYWGGAATRLLEAPVPLTVWLEGPGLASVARRLTACGRPSSLQLAPPSHLAVSNHPEQIEIAGTLLDTDLAPGNNAWYFHHQAPAGSPPRLLQARVENRADRPCRLLVTVSAAGPSRDELYVGHQATWRYLRRTTRGNAWLVRLQPGERYRLDERLLRPRDVGCGLGQIMVVEGPPPAFVVEAEDAGPLEDAASPPPPAPALPSAAGIVRGRGFFEAPCLEVEATYDVTGPYAFIPIGAPPYPYPLGEGTPNVGNYGVEYRVRLHLVNPTPEERRAWVVLGAAAGAARGSVEVDGRLVETPVLSTSPGRTREHGLSELLLPPGGSRECLIRIVPEPGSNYPVRIIAKPLPANR